MSTESNQRTIAAAPASNCACLCRRVMKNRQWGRLYQPRGLWSPVAVLRRPSKHIWRCSAATRRSRGQKRSLTSRSLTSPHAV